MRRPVLLSERSSIVIVQQSILSFFAHNMEEIGSTFDSVLRDFLDCNVGLLLSCLCAEFEGRTLRTTDQLYNSDD